jgi:hypothetical protein
MANPKKSSDFLKRIANALSGVDPDMPVIKTPASEMGGGGSIPKANYHFDRASEADGFARQFRERGNEVMDIKAQIVAREEGAQGRKIQSDAMARRKAEAERAKGQGTGNLLDRARKESRDFYDSDAGRNTDEFVTIKGDKARNPDKRAGSGFGVKIDDGTRKTTPKQISDFISQHAAGNHGATLDDFGAGLRVKKPTDKSIDSMTPNKPIKDMNMHEVPDEFGKPYSQGGNMGKYEFFSQFNKGDFKKYKSNDIQSHFKNNPSPLLSSRDRKIIGAAGAAGGAAGEVINYAMDEQNRQKNENSQQSAHSYWTRKKSGQ